MRIDERDEGRRLVDENGLVHVGYGSRGLLYTWCQYEWRLSEDQVRPIATDDPDALVTCIRCNVILVHHRPE